MSAERCANHPERAAASRLGARAWCRACADALAVAVRAAPLGVAPRDCFAAPAGGGVWRPLPGSGAAHWVAHELDVRARAGQPGCAAGFAFTSAALCAGRRELARELPAPRDLWVDLDGEACGIVAEVRRPTPNEVEIAIRRPGSAPGAAQLADFYRDLHGRGRFFR